MSELVTLFLVPQDFAMLRGGSSLAFWQVGIHHRLVVMLTEFISSLLWGKRGEKYVFACAWWLTSDNYEQLEMFSPSSSSWKISQYHWRFKSSAEKSHVS